MTQTNSKIFDDIAKLTSGAVSAAGGVYDEVKEIARNQGDKIVNDMELVRREDFDVLKQLVSKMALENQELLKRIEALESTLEGANITNNTTQEQIAE